MAPHKQICLLVGDEDDPVVAVLRHERRAHARDSGFMLFTLNAPSADDADEHDFNTYCLACLSEKHPEAERGLVLARAYGSSWWDEAGGEWIAEDEDGNEIVFDAGDTPINE